MNQKADAVSGRGMIGLMPVSSPNQFVNQFTAALIAQGYTPESLMWRPGFLGRSRAVIIHWPDDFMAVHGRKAALVQRIKIAMMHVTRRLAGTRYIWVAHNVAPHDAGPAGAGVRHAFLRALDGVIYLSAHSRAIVETAYPELRGKPFLETVHGHYRDIAAVPAQPAPAISGPVKLAYTGLIRPYKNLDRLVAAAVPLQGLVELTVAGRVRDAAMRDELHRLAGGAPHIHLDLRDAMFSDAEFDAIIDASDAVVLPYRDILNSGVALLALSRNRPLLAPAIGSLPELREQVGSEWTHLFEGEFGTDTLTDFAEWLRRTPRAAEAPLARFGWDRVGAELGAFIERL